MSPYPNSWRSFLILSSHLHLGLPHGFFPSGFPTKTLYTPLIHATCPAYHILPDLITSIIFVEEYRLYSSSLSPSEQIWKCTEWGAVWSGLGGIEVRGHFIWHLVPFFFFQCRHMSLMDFLWFSPSRLWPSVTDFWGWDAYEAWLRYPDVVHGDIWIWSTRRGLKPKFYYTTQTMVTMGALPIQEKSPWQNRESNPGPHDQ